MSEEIGGVSDTSRHNRAKEGGRRWTDQELLDVLRHGLSTEFQDPEFHSKLAVIRRLFYSRDFGTLFGVGSDNQLLGVYAAVYSPHRSLCYRNIFSALRENSKGLCDLSRMSSISCLGAGNGSELVGLLGALLESDRSVTEAPPLKVSLHDMADYGILPQVLEAFSSKDTRAIQSLNVDFQFPISDLLAPSSFLTPTSLLNADLVTAFFLLNELLTTSKAGFAKFIKLLMESMAPGSFLLVVDSAGSFSECVVGSGASSTNAESPPSAHMVYKFLDAIHCLESLYSQDSVWYRFPKDLRYPVKLNNMRYFIRLYRKRS